MHKPTTNISFNTIFSVFLLVAFFAGCTQENPALPLNGKISGTLYPIVEEASSVASTKYNRTGEALLISNEDTLARQQIESGGLYEGGDFSFNRFERRFL